MIKLLIKTDIEIKKIIMQVHVYVSFMYQSCDLSALLKIHVHCNVFYDSNVISQQFYWLFIAWLLSKAWLNRTQKF